MGTVSVETSIVHSTFCQVRLTNFPYDSQVCYITASHQGAVQFTSGNILHLDWALSPQWRVGDVYLDGYFEVNPLNNNTVSFFNIVITLERLPNFYLRNIMCPLVLMNALAIATFMIPLKSGERVSACLALVLGLTVFQIVIADIMPKTSQPTDEPLIIGYGVSSFVLLVSITIESIIAINISYQPWRINNRFARWLLLDIFATITLMKGKVCRSGNSTETGTTFTCKIVQYSLLMSYNTMATIIIQVLCCRVEIFSVILFLGKMNTIVIFFEIARKRRDCLNTCIKVVNASSSFLHNYVPWSNI